MSDRDTAGAIGQDESDWPYADHERVVVTVHEDVVAAHRVEEYVEANGLPEDRVVVWGPDDCTVIQEGNWEDE